LLSKKQRKDNFQNYINDDFGQQTWTTLFTYEINCDYNCGTILLYFNLTKQNIQNKSICPSLDTLRINQHIYLDIISKTSILIESLLVLIDSLSISYKDVSKNMTNYNLNKIHSIIDGIRANRVKYNLRRALGFCDISEMTMLSDKQKKVLGRAYDETQKIIMKKLNNLVDFYDEFHIVYGKTKHGLTYYSGQLPISSHDNNFLDSLLMCMDMKSDFDILNKKIPKRHLTISKKPVFFNFLSLLKFNQILQKRIISLLLDFQYLVRYICDNHFAYAINCGQPYLPFKIGNNKIKINFPDSVFNAVLDKNQFQNMFKFIIEEMNIEYPPLSIPFKTNAQVTNILNHRGIANVLLAG
jgi:hypothetical protein